ncbi:MAG: hypothetical protein M3265_07055 [Actinomycetota bacterium]|nr:hypothetical protein [Actinomycetota bacterium]
MLPRALRPPYDRGGARRAALTALVLVLLGGATAAFAITEALKLEGSPITISRFDREVAPLCRCPSRRAWLVVMLREREVLDADIVDSDGEEVRVLARGVDRPPGIVRFRWNGRDDEGHVVPEEDYRLRIELHEQGRTIVIPRVIRVVPAPSA